MQRTVQGGAERGVQRRLVHQRPEFPEGDRLRQWRVEDPGKAREACTGFPIGLDGQSGHVGASVSQVKGPEAVAVQDPLILAQTRRGHCYSTPGRRGLPRLPNRSVAII